MTGTEFLKQLKIIEGKFDRVNLKLVTFDTFLLSNYTIILYIRFIP